jgi:hypothetical protein
MDVAAYGPAAHPEIAADGQHVHASFVKLFHFLVVGESLAALGLSGSPFLRRARHGGVLMDRARRIAIGNRGQPNRGECLVVMLQDTLCGFFAQVLQQMPAVQDLHGLRSTFLDATFCHVRTR